MDLELKAKCAKIMSMRLHMRKTLAYDQKHASNKSFPPFFQIPILISASQGK